MASDEDGGVVVAESSPFNGVIGTIFRVPVFLTSVKLMADQFGHIPRGPRRIFKAAIWSLKGLRAAWLHESSFRLEVVLLLLLGPLGLWLGQTPVEKVLLVGSLFMVLAVELLNSAIEAVIERYGPEYHELAGRAKDMGSAAVFITLGNVVLCWVLILGPRLF